MFYNRVHLEVNDLETYFSGHPADIEDLLKLADVLVRRYLTTEAHERALHSNNSNSRHSFKNGAPETTPSTIIGDQILANSLLRMQDSMLHYEFNHAISSGDIGRAMNAMAVSPTIFNVGQFELTKIRFGHLHLPVPGRANCLTLETRRNLICVSQKFFRQPSTEHPKAAVIKIPNHLDDGVFKLRETLSW